MKHVCTIFLRLLSIFVLIGCGDDDNDPYSGIPSGEIVDVELREAALIGSGSSSGRLLAIGQKWWKLQDGEIRYNGSCDDETEDISPEDTYYGFYSSSQLYTKSGIDGTPAFVGSWQWVNSNKDALFINFDMLRGKELELRALNEDELTYLQEDADGDCQILTWQGFGDPISE